MRSLAIASMLVLCASVARADDEAPRIIRGTSRGYSKEILAADLSAVLVIPTTIIPTWSNDPWIWSIPLSAAPLVLAGPILHLAHERYLAAITSFLGWSSVVATSWAVGGMLAMFWGPMCVASQGRAGSCPSSQNLSMLGASVGIAVGVLGTTGMTLLDTWMARSFKRTHVAPSVSFDDHGASAGLLGSF